MAAKPKLREDMETFLRFSVSQSRKVLRNSSGQKRHRVVVHDNQVTFIQDGTERTEDVGLFVDWMMPDAHLE